MELEGNNDCNEHIAQKRAVLSNNIRICDMLTTGVVLWVVAAKLCPEYRWIRVFHASQREHKAAILSRRGCSSGFPNVQISLPENVRVCVYMTGRLSCLFLCECESVYDREPCTGVSIEAEFTRSLAQMAAVNKDVISIQV